MIVKTCIPYGALTIDSITPQSSLTLQDVEVCLNKSGITYLIHIFRSPEGFRFGKKDFDDVFVLSASFSILTCKSWTLMD